MRLDRHGAQHFPAVLPERALGRLKRLFTNLDARKPGFRLRHVAGLEDVIAPIGEIVRQMLGPSTRPVRAMLFNKSAARNWAVGWHQDRTIAVQARANQPGFVDWTVKSGLIHVVPPFAILQRMQTARIHLDPVTHDNGPLRIAPGTHLLGRIPEDSIKAIVAAAGERQCHANPGDVWLYATPILHASPRSAMPAQRRVLQNFYSADELPGDLQWFGI